MLGRGVNVVPRTNPFVPIGARPIFLGDSETDGREDDVTKSPPHVFTNILQHSLMPGNLVNPYTLLDTSTVYRSGRSGDSLADTLAHFNGLSLANRTDRSLIFWQESGSQDQDGQRTASEFGDTVDLMLDTVLALNPNAAILTSDAFNFDRGNPHTATEGQGSYQNENFRDWGGQSGGHNAELRLRFARRGKPNQLFIADVDYYIKAYAAAIGKANVYYSVWNETNFAHFKRAGNLMVALTWFKALRYPIRNLNLSGIPTAQVSQAHRDIALSLVA